MLWFREELGRLGGIGLERGRGGVAGRCDVVGGIGW